KATTPQQPVKVIPLYKKSIFRYAAAIAAVLLIAVSLFQFQNLNPPATEGNISYSTLVENNFLDLSLIDIEFLITDEMLEEQSILSNINTDEIEDYFLTEIDDTYLLYE